MVAYDGNSSSDEESGYTTTNVMLGYALEGPEEPEEPQEPEESEESSGDEISHIGGRPIWLDESSRPPPSFVRCKHCGRYMALLLQLNANLQQFFPYDTRRLYVWACKNRPCARKSGSVRAFREVKKPQPRTETKPQTPAPAQAKPTFDLGNALFGTNVTPAADNLNPFSSIQRAEQSPVNPFSIKTADHHSVDAPAQPQVQPLAETMAEKLKIEDLQPPKTASSEPWPEDVEFPDPYPSFYLEAAHEKLDPEPSAAEVAASSSKVQFDSEEPGSSSSEKDTFESSLDKAFQKFSDIVAQNPEQVLRYEFNGKPLLYAGNDTVSSCFVLPHGKVGAVRGIPRCDRCGAQRVFELQLMPYLISEVERDADVDINDGMEWGTVIVGTCFNNCGENGSISFKEEWVGVQWEERVSSR